MSWPELSGSSSARRCRRRRNRDCFAAASLAFRCPLWGRAALAGTRVPANAGPPSSRAFVRLAAVTMSASCALSALSKTGPRTSGALQAWSISALNSSLCLRHVLESNDAVIALVADDLRERRSWTGSGTADARRELASAVRRRGVAGALAHPMFRYLNCVGACFTGSGLSEIRKPHDTTHDDASLLARPMVRGRCRLAISTGR